MMVLISKPKDLNLIVLNGDISTLDLLHLRGHFGIPRFSGTGFVPGPASQARQPYVAPAPDAAPEQYPGAVGRRSWLPGCRSRASASNPTGILNPLTTIS